MFCTKFCYIETVMDLMVFFSLLSLRRFHSIDWYQDKKVGACKLALNTASFTNLHHATAHCTLLSY